MRCRCLILVGITAVTAGCANATAAGIQRVAAAHSDATYEASTQGCERSRRTETREFKALVDAVMWGKSVAALAPHPPCEILVDAVSGTKRETVYRVNRDAHGAWSIGAVAGRD